MHASWFIANSRGRLRCSMLLLLLSLFIQRACWLLPDAFRFVLNRSRSMHHGCATGAFAGRPRRPVLTCRKGMLLRGFSWLCPASRHTLLVPRGVLVDVPSRSALRPDLVSWRFAHQTIAVRRSGRAAVHW